MSDEEFNEEDLFDESLFDDLDFDETPGSAPPKGVKGYFKNVAKSAKNIGVGFAKVLMPQSTETAKGIAEALKIGKDVLTDRKAKIIERMQKKKEDSDGLLASIKKSVGSKVEAAKTAIKTGNFVKGDDDIDMDALMDGGGSEESTSSWYDDIFGQESYSSSYSSDEREELNTDELQMSESAGAGGKHGAVDMPKITTVNRKYFVNQGVDPATMQAIQSGSTAQLIYAYQSAARQAQLMEEARHKEKIALMANMQKNIFKATSFMGGMYKSSNEFYRKTLKGLIDMHGMMKENREMTIERFNNDRVAWQNNRVNTAQVFKSGFDGGAWMKGIGQNLKNMFDYSMFGELYQANAMMADVGKLTGKNTNLLTMMLNPFNLLSGLLLTGKNKIGFGRMDKTVASLPALLNNWLMKKSGEGGVFGRIAEALSIKDDGGYLDASKYAVTDLKKPTTWDMAARQSLVEIIPGYLAKILAAVSGGKELYYDHSTKQFKTTESLKKRYEYDRKLAVNSDFEFSQAQDGFKSSIYQEFKKKGIKMTDEKFEAMFSKMIDNMVMAQQMYDTDIARKDQSYRMRVTEGMMGSDEQNKAMLDVFNAIMMNPEASGIDKHHVAGFQRGLAIGKGAITEMHNNFGYNDSDDYKLSVMQNTVVPEQQRQHLEVRIEQLKTKLARAKDPVTKTRIMKELNQAMADKHRFLEFEGAYDDGTKDLTGKSQRYKELYNLTSGKGNVAQNIYELLLKGVVVYPQKMPKELWNERKDLIDFSDMRKEEARQAELSKEEELKSAAESSFEMRKSFQEQIQRAKENRNLTGAGIATWGPFKVMNEFIGGMIDKVNDTLEDAGILSDSNRYSDAGATKEDLHRIDNDWDKGVDYLKKHANDDTMLGKLLGFAAGVVDKANNKRKELNVKYYKDSDDKRNVFDKVHEKASEKMSSVVSFFKDIVKTDAQRKAEEEEKKTKKPVPGSDIPVVIKPKKSAFNWNGFFVVLADNDDFSAIEPLFKKYRYNYSSATEGIDFATVTGLFVSKKFKKKREYLEIIKTFREMKENVAEYGDVFIFYTVAELKEYFANASKIYVERTLTDKFVQESNESEWDAQFDSRDKGKMPSSAGGGINVDLSSSKSSVSTGPDVQQLSANFSNIESKLDRIIAIMEDRKDVSVENMPEVISLLSIIANNGGGGASINIKELEKAFDRQRKKGKKDKKPNLLTRIITKPFRMAWGGINYVAKNSGGIVEGLTKLPFLIMGGVLGGITGGVGLAIPGIAKLFSGVLQGGGIVARGLFKTFKGIGSFGVNLAKTLGRAGVKVGKGIFKATKGIASLGWKATKGAAKLAWKGAKKVGRGIKKAGGWVKRGGRWVKDKLKVVGGTLKDTVKNIAGNIGGVIGGLAGGLANLFTGPFFNKNLFENVVMIRLLMERMSGGPVDPELLKSTMSQYKSSLSKGLSKVSSKLKEWKEKRAKYKKLSPEEKEKEKAKKKKEREKLKKKKQKEKEKRRKQKLKAKAKSGKNGIWDNIKNKINDIKDPEKRKKLLPELWSTMMGSEIVEKIKKVGKTDKEKEKAKKKKQKEKEKLKKKKQKEKEKAKKKKEKEKAKKKAQRAKSWGNLKKELGVLGEQLKDPKMRRHMLPALWAVITNNTIEQKMKRWAEEDAKNGKDSKGSKKKTKAGFVDRGDGSGIREGSAADQIKDKEEKAKKERDEDIHEATMLTAAGIATLVGLAGKQKGDGKDGSNGLNATTTAASLLGLSAFGAKAKDFFKRMGKTAWNGTKRAAKGIWKATKFLARPMVSLGKTLFKGGVNIAKFMLRPITRTQTFKRGAVMVRKAFRGGKNLIKAAAKTKLGGKIAKLGKWIGKLFAKIFTNPKVVKRLGKQVASNMAKNLPKLIMTNIKKQGPKVMAKVTAKLGAKAGLASTGVGALLIPALDIAFAIWDFTTSFMNAGKYLGLPPGQKPTLKMRMVAGIVGAIDGALLGIPGLILGKDYLISSIYSLVDKSTPDDGKWIEERAKLYGVMKNFTAFESAYPSACIDKAFLQKLGNFMLYGGIGPSSSKFAIGPKIEKMVKLNAGALGFKSKKVFNDWKEKRYEPLRQIEESIVESLGGKKKILKEADLANEYRERLRSEATKFVKKAGVENLNSEAEDKTSEKFNAVKQNAVATTALAAAAAGGAATAAAMGSSPDAEGASVNEQKVKEGLNEQTSNINKTKNSSFLSSFFAPGMALLVGAKNLIVKGAQAVWEGGKKIFNGAVELFTGAKSRIDEKIMQMIQMAAAGANSVAENFKLAFDIIKSYIVRAISNGFSNRMFADDAYHYGLSYKKNKDLLSDFGITSPEQMQNLKMTEAIYIYYANYYKKNGGTLETLSKSDRVLAYHYFHHLMDTDQKTVDRMMKICRDLPSELKAHCFVQLRLNYYREVAAKDPSQANFLNMWLENVYELNKTLGFVFEEGRSYDIAEVDNKTATFTGSVSSSSSPNPNGTGVDPTTDSSYGTDSFSGNNNYSIDNTAMSEDIGSGGAVTASSTSQPSVAAGNAPTSLGGPMVSGSGETVTNKTMSMDFNYLKEVIEKELAHLNAIQANTEATTAAIMAVADILKQGFDALLKNGSITPDKYSEMIASGKY